jgi:hypothetical protein
LDFDWKRKGNKIQHEFNRDKLEHLNQFDWALKNKKNTSTAAKSCKIQ